MIEFTFDFIAEVEEEERTNRSRSFEGRDGNASEASTALTKFY